MSRRESYNDTFTGEADEAIREILGETDNERNNGRLRKVLVNVINNELTKKQKEAVILYYFKNKDMNEISKITGVTIQAVSATIARARQRIYRILRYYI